MNGTGDVLESFDFTVRACAQVGLADTGASGGAPAGVLVGLLLVTTGTGLARRFRQESCSHLAKR